MAFGITSFLSAEPPPEPPRVSEYASAPALLSEIDYYMERLAKSLKDGGKYSDASKSRVAKDASTVGLVLVGLGIHDDETALRASAPKLVELAEALVVASSDFEKASAALETLKKGIADGAEGGKALTWDPRFDLELLMKQTTTVLNKLKRNTKKEKSLAKRKDDAIGQAALLAIIGQATLVDSAFVEDESMLGVWYRQSADMRDSAGAVERGIAEGDFAAVTENVKLLQKSCDDCHETFRVETD